MLIFAAAIAPSGGRLRLAARKSISVLASRLPFKLTMLEHVVKFYDMKRDKFIFNRAV